MYSVAQYVSVICGLAVSRVVDIDCYIALSTGTVYINAKFFFLGNFSAVCFELPKVLLI